MALCDSSPRCDSPNFLESNTVVVSRCRHSDVIRIRSTEGRQRTRALLPGGSNVVLQFTPFITW